VIIAAGHRRIALLAPGDLKAGDVESQRGFEEATAASPHQRDLQATVARFDGTVASMVRQLDGLFRRSGRPTALVVPHSIYCLTIWSYFGARGIHVPNDLSVIAHVGTASTADAVRLARHAARAGAHAISSLPPQSGCSFAEVRRYYEALSSATSLPVLVYYFPEFSTAIRSLEEVLELCAIPNVIGLKFTDFDLYRLSLIRRAGNTVL
jgi:hypothetical protein